MFLLGWLPSWLNPFNWLLGRGGQFINDKPPAYDSNWVFPKLKKTNTKWWSVFSSMTIASVGFLSKMFIGKDMSFSVSTKRLHQETMTCCVAYSVHITIHINKVYACFDKIKL